jgi:hydrogenase maturation protease
MSVLVACVGNIFQGDDAFGVEVARRLSRAVLPAGVKVVDFGIRGVDLTYALMDGHDAVVLVDAASRGEKPGTLTLVECERPAEGVPQAPIVSAHDLDPARVMQLVAALGGNCGRVLLVACEPADLGGEDGKLGLSKAVAAAVAPAAQKILALAAELAGARTKAA